MISNQKGPSFALCCFLEKKNKLKKYFQTFRTRWDYM